MSAIAAPLDDRRRGYAAHWRRVPREAAYIVTSFALGTLWWSLLVSLLSTGVGLAVTLVGIPILVATMYCWIWVANSERWRARLLGLQIQRPYRPVTGSLLRRIWERAKDPAVWLDLVYLLLVLFPLSLVTFVVLVTVWGTGLWLATQTLYYWAEPVELWNGHRLDALQESLLVAALGFAILAVAPYVTGWLAAAHSFTVRRLLGRRMSERVEELTQQRSAAVDAAVAERRRIERDLHDGAQQRLTALAIDLGRAREKLDSDPAGARDLVEHAHEEAKQALAELRNLARGIHPAILTDRGLDAALSSLTVFSPVPVDLDVTLPGRLPVPIESAAYFVVAESLANVAKHAGATRATVHARVADGRLLLEVSDDGRGGAALRAGGGLEGLTVRVAAVDGTLTLSSPEAGPTIVRAELPCAW